jgi:hypothetical protein
MAVDLVEKRIAAGRCHRSYALDSELASSLLLGRVDCLLNTNRAPVKQNSA